MHVPEPALQRGGLSRGRGGEGVRVDAGQREVPECEPQVPAALLFDLLDRTEGLPRIRALVIPVLEDQAAGGRAADVIDVLVQRRQGQLAVARCGVERHGPSPGAEGGFGWLGGSVADRLSDEYVVDTAAQFL